MPDASLIFEPLLDEAKLKELLSFKPMFCSEPVITLSVEKIVSSYDVRNTDPITLDRLIKDELAIKLAQKLLEEDLIKIESNEDIEKMSCTVRATIKAIQE